MYYIDECLKILIFTCPFFYLSDSSTCPIPTIINGKISVQRNSSLEYYGDTIRVLILCKSNYTLSGKAINLCINSRWMHTFPTCQEKKLECLAPIVKKGWVECLTAGCNRFFVGSEAAIRCERGYRIFGSNRMHCKIQREKKPVWSSPVPKCVSIEKADNSLNEQDHQPFNLLYPENSSIMIIIIILSVLAGGLMLLMSVMLMNRLFQRRRLLRIQRSENNSVQPVISNIENIDVERNHQSFPTTRETSSDPPIHWNCFRTLISRNSRYHHMDTQTTEPQSNFEPDFNPIDNFEIYNTIYSDDQASLIQPPCYEEAVKCSQYTIVASKNSIDQHKLKNNQGKPKSNLSVRSTDKDVRQNSQRQIGSNSMNTESPDNINQSITSIHNTSMQSNFSVFQNTNDDKNSSQSNVANRSNDMDNISRRSARVHCPRVTNNLASESNVPFRSGSIETMAVSDGTSVTVHTLDSRGSNPSLGSMRPQTGSIGDPTNCTNICPTQYRHPLAQERSATPFTESDFAANESRYSPPPSYECSVNNPMIIKGTRYNHSNTISPSTNSNVALFVDNMACIEDSNDMSC